MPFIDNDIAKIAKIGAPQNMFSIGRLILNNGHRQRRRMKRP